MQSRFSPANGAGAGGDTVARDNYVGPAATGGTQREGSAAGGFACGTLRRVSKTLTIDGHSLTLDAVVRAARSSEAAVELAPAAKQRMSQSRGWVEDLIDLGQPVYG